MRVSVRRLALYPLFAAQRRGALLSPFLHQISPRSRTLFSETGVWEKDYRTETRRKVEEWWHPRIMAQWRKDALEEVRGSFCLLKAWWYHRHVGFTRVKECLHVQQYLVAYPVCAHHIQRYASFKSQSIKE